LQIFVLIEADLASFKPQPLVPEYLYEDDASNIFAKDPANSTDGPRFPKSLLLVRPLHIAYELRPVGPEMQRQIEPPPGLDLDAWIVPPPKKRVTAGAIDEEVTIKKKKKKGKEKTIIGGEGAPVKKKRKSATLTPEARKYSGVLTPEEAAELEKVGILYDYRVKSNGQVTCTETVGTTRATAR
jgi:AP-3 complex subunit delta-1